MKIVRAAAFRPPAPPDRDEHAIAAARTIVADVAAGGVDALIAYAERYDRLGGRPLAADRDTLAAAWDTVGDEARTRLARTAERIRRFAQAQAAALTPLRIEIDGFVCGHRIVPLDAAGCYVPGGRYPLPSSALMTIIPARVAGVGVVTAASPDPSPLTLAAAYVAGADQLLRVGGAQAIAALAFGVGCPAADVVVGPGNRFVAAAKRIVSDRVSIDTIAGPSEVCVVCDASADPATVAADLLAQAEHDTDAGAYVVTFDEAFAQRVAAEVQARLADLPTRATAAEALARRGEIVLCADLDEAVAVVNALAPEHLEVVFADPAAEVRVLGAVRHAGGVFVGARAAEVFGDYGAGPNHTLPTGGAARRKGGLSVFDFVKVITTLEGGDGLTAEQVDDAVWFARAEGLEAHARAALRRRA